MTWISVETEKFIIENFLVIVFAIAITVALIFPTPGATLGLILYNGKSLIQSINTIIVFFISGITLKVEDFADLSKYTKPILYGILSINLLTTVLAPFFLHATFLAPNFRLGLTIFSCVPTTLGVGVALTQLATGDVMLALILTVLTNSLGTLTTPFLLKIYLNSNNNSEFHFDSFGLFINLIIEVLIPTVIGIAVRYYLVSLRSTIQKYKTSLSVFSTSNLAMIVWMALSKSRDLLLQQSIKDIIVVLIAASVMHIIYLIGNFLVATKYGLDFEVTQAVTVVIMSSQKSNPVALAVINGMGLPHPGLVVIPGILGQLAQIFIGSFIARSFRALIHEEKNKHIPISTVDEESKELVPTGYYQYEASPEEEKLVEEAQALLEVLE
eukprot:gene13782-15198_t